MERIGKTPALALGEWVANRDLSQCTHEVRTCYAWDKAYSLQRDGWEIERAAWQSRKGIYPDDKGGWIIIVSRKRDW